MRKTLPDSNAYLTHEQKKLKSSLENSIRILETLVKDCNDAINQLPVVQYNHFEDMRRDIDIRRETLIQELYEFNHDFDVETVIERLQKQSARMIKDIDEVDKEFRNKCKHLGLKPIEYDGDDERRHLNELFRNPSCLSKKVTNTLKYENEIKQDELRHLNDFLNLINRALTCNRFIYDQDAQKDPKRYKSLGEIEFYTKLPDDYKKFSPKNLSINENQTLITTSLHQNKISIWNIGSSHNLLKSIKHEMDKIRCSIIYATYKFITSGDDKSIKIWDLTTNECRIRLYGHTKPVTCLKLIENETLLVSGSFDTTIKVWNILEGVCVSTLNAHSDWIMCFDLLDNENLISGSADKSIHVWDLIKKKECLKTFEETSCVYCVKAVSNDLFASGTRSGRISIWNFKSGKCVNQLLGHSLWVVGFELTSSNQLISCSTDQTIRVWDGDFSTSINCIRVLCGHNGWVNCIRLNNKEELISGSDDKCIKVWDIKTGECLKTILTESSVFAIEFCSIF